MHYDGRIYLQTIYEPQELYPKMYNSSKKVNEIKNSLKK